MEFDRLDVDLKELRRRNRALGRAVSGLALALIVALLVILKIAGTERTVLVPPTIEKAFWVTGAHGSKDYLEQMASYFAYLILDVDPSTIDWKRDALLDWVSPDQHAAMKTRQDLEAERLKRMNGTTYFRPQQLVANEERQSVVIRGRLRTQVNGQETSNETKAFLVEFDYAGGRATLKTFKEIPNEQPGSAQTAAAAAAAAR
jgi:conjugal transfer pilus assembly protein TraE